MLYIVVLLRVELVEIRCVVLRHTTTNSSSSTVVVLNILAIIFSISIRRYWLGGEEGKWGENRWDLT